MSCGLTGLEIAEGDACLVAIVAQRYNEWEIVVPPLRGEYADYGYIRLSDAEMAVAGHFGVTDLDWEPLDYKPDGNAPSIGENQWVLPFWISAVAYDALMELRREYSEVGPEGTIGQDTAAHMSNLRDAVAQALTDFNQGGDYVAPDGTSLRDLLFSTGLTRVTGSSTVIWGFDKRIIAAARSDTVDEMLVAYERAFLLAVASHELRRPLVGQNGAHGPQHAGHYAMAAMSQVVLAECERRIAEDAAREF